MKKRKPKEMPHVERKADEAYYLNLANVVLNGQIGTLPFEVPSEDPKGFLGAGEPDTGMLGVPPKQQPPFLAPLALPRSVGRYLEWGNSNALTS